MMQNPKGTKRLIGQSSCLFYFCHPVSPLTSFLWFSPKTFYSDTSVSICVSMAVLKYSHKYSLRGEVMSPPFESGWAFDYFNHYHMETRCDFPIEVLKGHTASTFAGTLILGVLSCSVRTPATYAHHAGEIMCKHRGGHPQLSHALATKATLTDSGVKSHLGRLPITHEKGFAIWLESLVKT